MFIYLAQPIDQAGSNMTMARVLNAIHNAIREQGHSVFRPAQAYRLTTPPWDERTTEIVDRINTDALRQMDMVIAVLLPDVPTMGTIAEIELAMKLAIPVCIVTTEALRQSSVQLAAWERQGADIVFCGPTGYLAEFDLAAMGGSMATASFTRLVRAIHNTTSFGDSVPTWVEGLPVGPGDLQVRLMDPAAKTPQRAHQTDAGLDLATLEDSVLHHGGRMLLRTGIQAPPPEGWWGLIKARSSTQKLGIQINEAVIDAGYQGELMISATLIHQGRSSMKIEAGTRLAQYILIPAFTGSVRQVDSFAPSLRGDRGFGSSGA